MVLRVVRAVLLAALLAAAGLPARAQTVAVVLSENGGAYAEVVAGLREELARRRAEASLSVIALADLAQPRVNASVVVAVGVRAARAVLASDVGPPVLVTLVPRVSADSLLNGRGARRVSAIYLDQPFSRQCELVRQALPGRVRVGVLFGPESVTQSAALEQAAAERQMAVVAEAVVDAGDLYPALNRVLRSAGVLLAVPDAMVYNSATIQNVLLTAYRSQVPMIGFSPAYVRAGALLAVYSTPAQIGRQAGAALAAALEGAALPPPQYPREFEVAVNDHVARSLGLSVAPAEALAAALAGAERAR